MSLIDRVRAWLDAPMFTYQRPLSPGGRAMTTPRGDAIAAHCAGCDGTVDVGQMSGRGDPCPGITPATPAPTLNPYGEGDDWKRDVAWREGYAAAVTPATPEPRADAIAALPNDRVLVSWLDSAIDLCDLHHVEQVTVRAHMLRLVRERFVALGADAETPDRSGTNPAYALAQHRRALRAEAETPNLTEYGHCGSLAWTVEKWGRVTHKHGCPNRTDPWCQSHPAGCEKT